ncbi:MAG TPA: prolipoprotein diacylglyceryl transferase [Gemmatimonadales bacterium]|jgi:phosphatidylglycerol:prolipoprotein diacylglycerol transferase|nr:prolipoprotein diacylglyceryl transferase [Gemmatimonadales bacterium]
MTTVYPFNFHVGPLNVTGYGIMMMVGFLMGGWLMDRDLRERGLHHEYAADMTVAAVIGGIVGAKLWYVAATGELSSLFSRGGLVWYGGFLGGVTVVLLNGRRLGVPMRWTMELVAPALPAAYALGRIGCFMVGDDYGVPSSLPWAVKFPQGLPPTTAAALARDFHVPIQAGVSPETVLAVHPTQLYETILMLAVFMLLWRLRKHQKGTGWLFGLYLVLAGAERFLVEFLRAKEDRLFGNFTVAQLTALAIVLVGGFLMARWKNAGVVAPGPFLTGNRPAK